MSQISRTFANQNLLPRLPIPALKDTIAKYLRSTRPLFASPSAYSAYARIASDFEATLGSDLHKRLEAHAHSFNNGPAESQIQHNTSWIEAWWLKLAYLSWREPLLVNSNWYMLVAPHPHTPVAPLAPFVPLNSSVTSHSCQFTAFQLVRAAGYISNLIDFKDKVDNETMIPETTRTGPLCMNQYRNIFGISRIPVAGCDVLVGAHPSPHQHIVVLVRDQLYVVWVYDKQSGKRLAISEIHRQLCDIVVDVEKSTHMEPPIGVFTGHHRDTWAKWHKYLVELGGNNTESFKWIDTALLTVSLDDVIIPSTLNAHAIPVGSVMRMPFLRTYHKFSERALESYLFEATFHGVNGTNRWFDKCLGVVVTQDARIGVNGEHSPCDALVPALAIDQAAKSEPSVDPVGAVIMSSPNSVHRLKWTVDASVHDALVEAKEFVKKLTGNSDVAVLHFTEYGAGLIKKTAKVSPDAFIQMCLQLTYYRLHGACTAVYETASTRKYLHGRTETCRSYSVESKAFVDVFDAKDVPPLKKYELFRTACKNHVETISSAGDGHGVDRHLLGLKLMLKPGEGESPFFTHPVYTQSSTWRLSTSGLFSSDRMHGTGFGAVMPDGYGMNYTIGESIIKIGIESKMDCKTTSSKAFSDEFAVVLREVAQLCRDVEAEVPVAKL